MAVNTYGWRRSGVNHVLIFELDPRDHLSEQHIIEVASVFSVLWSISVIGFMFSEQLSIPAFTNPLALIVIMLVFLFNPAPILMHTSRFWLLKVLVSVSLSGRPLTSPQACDGHHKPKLISFPTLST